MPKKDQYIVPPLSGGYMAASMIGFLISVIWVFPKSQPWGLAFAITFAAMFLSAIKSMTYTPPELFVELETRKKTKKESSKKKSG